MPSPKDEIVRFKYLEWQELYATEKPFQVFSAIPSDAAEQRSTNLVFKHGEPVTVHDIRGQEADFNLDKNGFMVRRQAMPKADLSTEETLRKEYLPHIEQLIHENLDGVDELICFDWGVRKNVPLKKDRINVNDKMQLLEPATQVHCDQSPVGAVQRLQQHAPEFAEDAFNGRLRIVNVWRPLNNPALDNSLAVCDGQTIDDSDLVEADHITRVYLGRTMYGLFSPRHKWYYLNAQRTDELFFIKIFDSDDTVSAHRSLHASFNHAVVPPNTPPRESIEVRFLVITRDAK